MAPDVRGNSRRVGGGGDVGARVFVELWLKGPPMRAGRIVKKDGRYCQTGGGSWWDGEGRVADDSACLEAHKGSKEGARKQARPRSNH